MSVSKLLRVIGLAIIMLVSLVGQGQAQEQPPLSQPVVAIGAVAGSPGTLSSLVDAHTYVNAASSDPVYASTRLWLMILSSGEVIQNIYETLVFYDGANPNAFLPQLASSYDLSVDGLTWTFHIRTGVTFHNGDSLTPADVAYSFQRGLLQGGSCSPQWLLAEPFFGVGISDVAQLVDPTSALVDDPAGLSAADPAKLLAACEQVKAAIVADNTAGTVTMHLAQPWGPFLGTSPVHVVPSSTRTGALPIAPGWILS